MLQSRELVLASTSTYRRALLERLHLTFETHAPGIDESPIRGEAPADTALRLASLKADAAAGSHPQALIVGSDQVAMLGSERLDKPGSHARAREQLTRLSGRAAEFNTAVCVLDARSGARQLRLVPCRVRFRALDARTIETYLEREQPYDCAGSAKSEGLGIALIAGIETADPTALIGLPLIALTEMLSQAGLDVLG